MRRVLRRIGPGKLEGMQLVGRGNALRNPHFLECVQPMVVVTAAIVGVALQLGRADAPGQRFGSLRPAESRARMQHQRHGKSVRLPGL